VPPGLAKKGGGLADLWHRHPWIVVGGGGAAAVVGYVFWKQAHPSKTKGQGNKGGSRRHDRIVIYRGGRGRGRKHHRGQKHGPGGAQDVAGPATGAEDGPPHTSDEAALTEQMGALQDALGAFVLAHQRGVSPGGPNPGPQAPGMEPLARGHDLTGTPPSPATQQMP